jgi:hypothetical protein
MEVPDRLLSLRRAVEYGLREGKQTLIVNLELLDLLLRGELPVGGNELPPEEVTRRLYEVKKKLDDTTRELGFANVRGDQAEALLAALKALGKKWNWDELMPLDVYFDQGFDELMAARAELARMHAATGELLGNGPLTCANCGEESTNPGQFVQGDRWVCCHACRKELIEKDSYRDLAARGGIVDAP